MMPPEETMLASPNSQARPNWSAKKSLTMMLSIQGSKLIISWTLALEEVLCCYCCLGPAGGGVFLAGDLISLMSLVFMTQRYYVIPRDPLDTIANTTSRLASFYH
jgi:hypothetical protein